MGSINLKKLTGTTFPQFNKTSDLLAVVALYRNSMQSTNVIVRLKADSPVPDYLTVRAVLPLNLITASIKVEDLIQLDRDDNVLSWNCAKSQK